MPMMGILDVWLAEHRASGKLVDVWSFAGRGVGAPRNHGCPTLPAT